MSPHTFGGVLLYCYQFDAYVVALVALSVATVHGGCKALGLACVGIQPVGDCQSLSA